MTARRNLRPTQRQIEARERNWRIRCFRALFAQSGMLTGNRRKLVEQLIDQELSLLGAEKSATRRDAVLGELS
jgi:hypothetical protein